MYDGPLTRYVKFRVVRAPGMPGTFSPPPTSKETVDSDHGMYHGTCVTNAPWCMSVLLTHGGWENVSGIPSACATHNYTYWIRGPWTEIREPSYYVRVPYSESFSLFFSLFVSHSLSFPRSFSRSFVLSLHFHIPSLSNSFSLFVKILDGSSGWQTPMGHP